MKILLFCFFVFSTGSSEILTIYYSANNRGSLEFCGCPHDRNSGVSGRLSKIMSDSVKNYVLIEAGNLFAINQDSADFGFYHDAYKNIGRTLVCPGNNDIGYIDQLKKISDDIVSLNVLGCQNGAILTVDGFKVGILSAVDPVSSVKYNGLVHDLDFIKLRDIFQEFRNNSDILIFISSLSEEDEAVLFSTCKDIDIFISVRRINQSIDYFGTRIFVSPGSKNTVLGKINIDISNRNKVWEHKFVSVDPDSVEINSKIDSLLKDHKINSLQKKQK